MLSVDPSNTEKRDIATRIRNHHKLPQSYDSSPLPPPNQELKQLLHNAKLPLRPISDLGYYGWIPIVTGGQYNDQTNLTTTLVAATIPLSNVTANDIRQNIDLSMTPKIPCDLDRFQESLPRDFSEHFNSSSMTFPNKYPYGQTSIASLYAAKQKGVFLQNVNFMFGSYTLYHLAYGCLDGNEKSVVARVPGTNIVLMTRYKEYMQHLGSKGHDFERMIIDGDDAINNNLDSVVHLQLMQLGSSKILFAGEVDAMDPSSGNPIEIKFGGMAKRAVRILFQMISSGSLSLIQGLAFGDEKEMRNGRWKRVPWKVRSIRVVSLRDFAEAKPRNKLGRAISARMKLLRELTTVENLPDGQVMEASFHSGKKGGAYGLQLAPSTTVSIGDLFPNEQVVKSLLSVYHTTNMTSVRTNS